MATLRTVGVSPLPIRRTGRNDCDISGHDLTDVMCDERRKWRKCVIDDEKSMLGDLHDCYDNWKLLLTWPLADGFHDRRDVIHLSANVERKWRVRLRQRGTMTATGTQ